MKQATPWQMRRHARRMRRYGLQPSMVITPHDKLPDVMLVVLGRFLWRYRSELAPISLSIAAMSVAFLLHAKHPSWWFAILAITTVAAVGTGFFGNRLALSRLIERVYAASVVTVSGVWLAAATAYGPLTPPLPRLLLITGVILAVPWWAHRRRRARVRVERKLAAWPEISNAVGLTGSLVMSAKVDVWGWRARFRLGRGQTINDVITKVPAIESSLGTFRGAVRVYPTPDDKANRFELRVLDSDPHADAIPWPGPSVASITEPIEMGPFEDAEPARVLFLRRHGLFGGTTGSGKSGGVNVLIGNLAACGDVVIWAIDLKRGMELMPWASCIDRLATTPDQARVLLRDAAAIVDARATWLTAQGKREWHPTPELPALVIVIDEYAELSDEARDALIYADSIARLGRAVAATLVAATQRPTQKAMGQGAVRSQMDVRICFRVRERKDVDLVLGQGMLNAGWSAHSLNAPGKFLVSATEHDTPRRARAYLVTNDVVDATAARYADGRPSLDEVSQHAVSDAATGHGEDPDAPETTGGRPPDRAAEAMMWDALWQAGDIGITIRDLMTLTGNSRSWVYNRIQDHVAAGRVERTETPGCWRAIHPPEPDHTP